MRPLELKLKGVRSWRSEQHVDFRDLGLFAIVGETGAGKSSLLEALVYALYNATTFSERDVRALISDGEQTMRVSLDFEADGKRWRVTRSTSVGSYPPSTHQLICLSDDDEAPTEREGAVNARIRELVGLNYKGFTSAVLLPQGRFQTLLTAPDGDRSTILKGIFRLNELDRVREFADGLRRTLEPPLEELRNERAGMLEDPAAVAGEQRNLAAAAEKKLQALRKLYAKFVGASQEAAERSKAGEQAAAAAAALQDQIDRVPTLEEASAAEAEIAKRYKPLEATRATHIATRNETRKLLAEAAAVGETTETMARACQTLSDAAEQLPMFGATDTRLQAEGRALAAADTKIAAAAREYTVELTRLEREEVRITGLTREAEVAEEHHRSAASALAVLRQRESDLEAWCGTRDELASRHTTAASAEQEAKKAEEEAQSVVSAARERYDEVRRRDSAAAAAAGVVAGDQCPVCARLLPEDFEAPLAPDLDEAHTALDAAQTALNEASRKTSTAAAELGETKRQLAAAEKALREADAEVATARPAAERVLGGADLDRPDDQLLGPVEATARAARETASNAASDLAGAKAGAKATGEQLEARRQQQERERQRIERELAEAAAMRARLETALDELPQRFRTETRDAAALAEVRQRADKWLAALSALAGREADATAEIERVDRLLAELADERLHRVLAPRREAAAKVAALQVALENLAEPRATLEPPADEVRLDVHLAWIEAVVAAARGEAEGLEQVRQQLQAQAEDAATTARGFLAYANGADDGHEIDDPESLCEAIEDWAVGKRTAAEMRDRAEAEIEVGAKIAEQVSALESLRRSCDEVARLLTDAKFIRWLVGRRQRAVLEVASDRLLEITAGRYGFSEDFRIVDRRTGQPRSARTLSGGETFQASLALALGMVELAARSGGRIGSFYLDEGFGSLDPNALDEALTALEQRAQSGQMIAVISHVSAVAERLQHVLRVKSGPGGSEIEPLDAKAGAVLVGQEIAEAAEVAV